MPVKGRPFLLVLFCALLALLLSVIQIVHIAPLGEALPALFAAQPATVPAIILHDSVLPRVLTAWAAGIGLALAAALLQQVLRNPLASSTTLGVSAGAGLALAVATLAAPGLLASSQPLVVLAGALAAIGAVLALGRQGRLSPDRLAIAGLLVTLGCGAFSTCLLLLRGEQLGAVAIWGNGSLDQQGWLTLRRIVFLGGPAVLLILPLLRPLRLMQMADEGARSLGLSPGLIRALGVLLAAWLSAVIVGAVGAIGFVDLAAAAIIRLLGVTSLRRQLVWTAILGAVLLWLADEVTLLLGRFSPMVLPTGAVTALAGAPVLIWLASRLRRLAPPETRPLDITRRRLHARGVMLILLVALVLLTGVSLCLGRGPHGWFWAHGPLLSELWPWRAPRVLGALAAGICLAVAGVLVQGLTANPLASPELIGVGPAAALAGVVLILVDPGAGRGVQLLAGGGGAAAALALLLLFLRGQGFAPSRMVLLGIGLSALLGAAINLATALMPLDLGPILAWVAGSTYHVTAGDALWTLAVAAVGIGLALVLARVLTLLPLGPLVAGPLGLSLTHARLSVILLAAMLSAAGTLMVGPFAFVGVMAPHMARLLGARRPGGQVILAGILGALLMVLADFLGRNLLFPYQLPAGTMASVFGLFATAILFFKA